jgi:SAM-dependent methyltransferase
MLDVANSEPSLPDSAPITYIESPAAPLGVESAAFDFVVCQQGLQFFPDRLATVSEMCRALKPGGGFSRDQCWERVTLPLIFEGGIAQAARSLAASPLAPSLATLPAGTQLRLNAAIGAHLAACCRMDRERLLRMHCTVQRCSNQSPVKGGCLVTSALHMA